MGWRRYWVLALGAAGGLAVVLYALVLVVDPFDSVWFSPPFDREPVSQNQRYSYPALARKARFDSAVFGTSSTRLLKPEALDAALGASFVNLSMNAATPPAPEKNPPATRSPFAKTVSARTPRFVPVPSRDHHTPSQRAT